MNDIKVYQMNDYEWWASKLDKRETLDFYLKETGVTEEENPLEDIRKCDIDKECVWWETTDKEDIERLGDYDEIVHYKDTRRGKVRNPQVGNLKRIGNEVYKYITLREAIKKHEEEYGISDTPFMIASTDW